MKCKFDNGTFVKMRIKDNSVIDRLVEELRKKLGYTSKAEFVREAVLRKNIGILGLHSMDMFSKRETGGDAVQAVKWLASQGFREADVKEELLKARGEIEKMLLGAV